MTSEIGEFLRAKRERVAPEERGLPAGGQRRVPGLRREEVALLAGISPDYYVRLEQGRARAASDQVLDAISRVLSLDDVERDHLRVLARPATPLRAVRAAPAPGTRPGLTALLDAMPQVPAFVLGPAMDVLAVNLLGDALIALPEGPRNMARHVFLDPTSPAYYPEWDKVARETAAHLRRMAGLLPDTPEIAALIGELTIGSDEFVRAWARQEVAVKTHGRKLVDHPEIGRLSLAYETLALPDEPALMLVTYTAADERTADALRTLGSWAASGAAERADERTADERTAERSPRPGDLPRTPAAER